MKYIIMCGGTYRHWITPRQLTKVAGETLVERTIRLLRESGADDIAISSNNPIFEQFGVPVLHHTNSYTANGHLDISGYWYECFYPMDEPVCYIFGDVVFSPEAMKCIVETDTDSIQFFASAPPFAEDYSKPWAEPFALKVVDNERLREAIQKVKILNEAGVFYRRPIMWELWAVINGTNPNGIDYGSYAVINDYTCDIDEPEDVQVYESILRRRA